MAIRTPPMIKLPSAQVDSELELMRKNARCARKPEALQDIYDKYKSDDVVCINLARNNYTTTQIRECLAMHQNPEIRLEIAKNSNFIKDNKVLTKLVVLGDCKIRYQVARSTDSDSILELLFKSNPLYTDIKKMCIRRISNADIIENLVFKNIHESKNIMLYIEDIINNRRLDYRRFLLTLKYVEKLSIEQINLVLQHIEEHRKSMFLLAPKYAGGLSDEQIALTLTHIEDHKKSTEEILDNITKK